MIATVLCCHVYQVLPSFIRKFHSGSTQLGLRFFSTDQDVSRSHEQADVQADVDPYGLVQKYLDAIAGNIKKVCMLFLVAEALQQQFANANVTRHCWKLGDIHKLNAGFYGLPQFGRPLLR